MLFVEYDIFALVSKPVKSAYIFIGKHINKASFIPVTLIFDRKGTAVTAWVYLEGHVHYRPAGVKQLRDRQPVRKSDGLLRLLNERRIYLRQSAEIDIFSYHIHWQLLITVLLKKLLLHIIKIFFPVINYCDMHRL